MNRMITTRASCALALVALSFPATVHAAEPVTSDKATTHVELSSDTPGTELIQHAGTAYGTGTVGGRVANITTFYLERICRAPCTANVPTEGHYFVDAPGMHAQDFELPAGARAEKLQVRGASSLPLTLSLWGVYLGGVSAATGGIVWGVMGDRAPSSMQTLTLVGGGVLVAGIAGLILSPRTHVYDQSGAQIGSVDTKRSSGIRFNGNGFVF
jgi:hypothetical protein